MVLIDEKNEENLSCDNFIISEKNGSSSLLAKLLRTLNFRVEDEKNLAGTQDAEQSIQIKAICTPLFFSGEKEKSTSQTIKRFHLLRNFICPCFKP